MPSLPAADVTIVVPTYNERDRLAELVDALFDAFDRARLALELVIVDDNSPDGTGALADELARTRRMQVIHRPGKLGLGTAVVAGFGVASAPVLGVSDADLSHPPSVAPRLVAALRAANADIVIASRYIPGGSTPDWPFSRRLMSRLACWLARPLTPIRDATSGFFVIRDEFARGVPIQAGGFKICLELLIRGWPIRLVEVPYRFADRELGESKMSMREAARYFVQLKDLYLFRWRGPARTAQQHRIFTTAELERLS